MDNQTEKTKDVIRPTDAEGIRIARTLIRTARFGAIAVLEPTTGWPFSSRVGVSTAHDGALQIFVSGLSQHTQALSADSRCSLLLGEPGKGDPLAYPRVTVICEAVAIDRNSAGHEQALARHLLRHPKARLYAGLPDFRFFRLEPQRASLNGGFGKAYLLTRDDLMAGPTVTDLAVLEAQLSEAFEAKRPPAREILDRLPAGGPWRFAGLDQDGVDFVSADDAVRFSLSALPANVEEMAETMIWPR